MGKNAGIFKRDKMTRQGRTGSTAVWVLSGLSAEYSELSTEIYHDHTIEKTALVNSLSVQVILLPALDFRGRNRPA